MLESAQKAVLNILEDFDAEKNKVEAANLELRREVAERKLAEQALKEQRIALERSNEELEQFAYVASHDLQEPLRMVASYTQILARRYQGKLDEDADRYIAFAVDGVKRMQSLIKDVLTYSRVRSQGAEFSMTPFSSVLERAMDNLQAAIRETGAAITVNPLPAIAADATQMVHLFQNLIGNAIKFRSGEPPRIHVTAARNGNHWTFSVSDNGIGIKQEYHDKIFIIFQCLHTRQTYPGTGIGLALCKRIVERHGGRIWVDSQPGKGSVFRFSLPDREEGR
ncbi:MAG: hypothetical protein HY896_06035 [Deltaproteobacteria bacterium]|nr:hypothetical protein [Deltaproteobacteria bacterium]